MASRANPFPSEGSVYKANHVHSTGVAGDVLEDVWICNSCTFFNSAVPNHFTCIMCDSFQLRGVIEPKEYGNGDMSKCFVFPRYGSQHLIMSYYDYNLKLMIPMAPHVVCRMIASYLSGGWCPNDRVDIRWGKLWYTGVVQNVDPDTQWVYVRYDGWSSRWNEWIDTGSGRVETYRSLSQGDTGHKATLHLHRRRGLRLRSIWILIEALVVYGYSFSEAERALNATGKNLADSIEFLRRDDPEFED